MFMLDDYFWTSAFDQRFPFNKQLDALSSIEGTANVIANARVVYHLVPQISPPDYCSFPAQGHAAAIEAKFLSYCDPLDWQATKAMIRLGLATKQLNIEVQHLITGRLSPFLCSINDACWFAAINKTIARNLRSLEVNLKRSMVGDPAQRKRWFTQVFSRFPNLKLIHLRVQMRLLYPDLHTVDKDKAETICGNSLEDTMVRMRSGATRLLSEEAELVRIVCDKSGFDTMILINRDPGRMRWGKLVFGRAYDVQEYVQLLHPVGRVVDLNLVSFAPF